jgi:hypothetical protein
MEKPVIHHHLQTREQLPRSFRPFLAKHNMDKTTLRIPNRLLLCDSEHDFSISIIIPSSNGIRRFRIGRTEDVDSARDA